MTLDTFPMFDEVNPNEEYEWQMQGYMELYGVDYAKLCYTLSDCDELTLGRQWPYMCTPDEKQRITLNLVYTKKEFDRLKTAFFPNTKDIKFVEIPEWARIKVFAFEKDETKINAIKERVDLCQKYINKLLTESPT